MGGGCGRLDVAGAATLTMQRRPSGVSSIVSTDASGP